MFPIIVSVLFGAGFLLYAMPRLAKWKAAQQPVDPRQDSEVRRVIEWVRYQQKKAASIWGASFTGHSITATICMLIILAVFIMLDLITAYYKGKVWWGIIFYACIFVAVDILQPAAISSSDKGAGSAVFKKRDPVIWWLVIIGLVLNIYVTQNGYGYMSNVTNTAAQNQAKALKDRIAKADRDRKRLAELEAKNLREPVLIENEINAILVTEPTPRGACKDPASYGKWSRKNCKKVLALRNELEEARERNRLAISVPKMQKELADKGGMTTEVDPTAKRIVAIFEMFGIDVGQLTVSEILGRILTASMSFIFTLVVFWWSDRANEAKESAMAMVREDTDRALADIGYVQEESGRIRPAADGELGIAPGANVTINHGLAGLENDPTVKAVEMFLMQKIVKPLHIQSVLEMWRSGGHDNDLHWLTERIKYVAMKNTAINYENGLVWKDHDQAIG